MKQNASAERTPSINFKTSQELEQIFDAITDRSEKMNLMSFALLANACKHICKNISSRTPPSLCSVAEQLIRETLMLIQENLFKVTYNKDSTKLDEKLPDLSNRLNDFLEKLDHANRIKPTLNVDRRLAKELSAGSRLSEKFRSPPNRSHSSMEEDEIFPGSSAKMASRAVSYTHLRAHETST